MSNIRKTIDDITRSKTTFDGAERFPGRDSLGDFKGTLEGVKDYVLPFVPSVGITLGITADYDILDDDNVDRVEIDTSGASAAVTVMLPSIADNAEREISFAQVLGSTYPTYITVNAADTGKLTSFGLSTIQLSGPGDYITFKHSATSGLWEIVKKSDKLWRYSLKYEVASGTNGGAMTASTWNIRPINSEPKKTIYGASLSSNVITLPAGKYKVRINAASYVIGDNKLRLYNTADAAVTLYGINCAFVGTGSLNPTNSPLEGEFELLASKTLRIDHYCTATNGTTGAGRAFSLGIPEIFLTCDIEKIA